MVGRTRGDALDQAGEDLAAADLDEARDAGLGQRQRRTRASAPCR